MGLTGSKTEEMVYYTDATPVKYELPKRRLNIDPRSPSDDITRTPIVVEKTPETLIDPRSPTPGIVRTPITAGVNPVQPLVLRQQHGENEIDLMKQDLYYSDAININDNCTLININSSETEDNDLKEVVESQELESSSDVSNERDSSSDVSPEENDDRRAKQNLLQSTEGGTASSTEHCNPVVRSNGDMSFTSELQNLSLSDDEATTLLTGGKSVNDKKAGPTKKPKSTSKIPRPCQPKKLFTEKRKCEVTRTVFTDKKKCEVSRSPLSTVIVDTNSPRNIMQRKQSKNIDLARQCHFDANRPNDKENFNQ